MSGKQPKFKQAETITLAPDALVYINGRDTVTDMEGNELRLRDFISDINTSLSVDSVPGTAGFTISIPDHSKKRDANANRYTFNLIMSEVEIYFKGRFPRETENIQDYPYYPSFWGIITSVSENYSDGVNTITISCADILRWWGITNVTVNPSVIASVDDYFTAYPSLKGEVDLTDKDLKSMLAGKQIEVNGKILPSIFGNIYADKNVFEIIADLAKFSLKNMTPLRNALNPAFGSTEKVGFDLAKEAQEEMMKYWAVRLNRIGRNIRMYGIKNVTTVDGQTKIELDDDQLLKAFPYTLDEGSPQTIESGVKYQLDIANECKDLILYEFYMDVNGEIIFKPPYYNMNVITNTNSVIRDVDIVTMNFNEAEAEVVTRLDVKGNLHQQYATAGGKDVITGIAINQSLAKQYGLRVQTREVRRLSSSEKCLYYAQGELAKLNALIKKGSVTIAGRPELRLGYPVYIPSKDAFYYIKGIDHSFTYGGSFVTTLTVVGERKRVLDENGDPIKYQIVRSTNPVEDTTETVEGTSYADLEEDHNNFIKQLNNVCYPFKPNSVDTFDMVEPNFVDNFDNYSMMTDGDWTTFSNIKLPEDYDSKIEYQTTDGEGFELIPFFNYGLGLKFSDKSEVVEMSNLDSIKENEINAEKAQDISPDSLRLEINPNNVALTLDNEDSSMLSIYDYTKLTKAFKAQTADPTNNTEKQE